MTPQAQSNILKWVESFNNPRSIDKQSWLRESRIFQADGPTIILLFLASLDRGPEVSCCRFRDSLLTIQTVLKVVFHMFSYNITRLDELQPQFLAQNVPFSQLSVGHMSSNSSFPSSECFFLISVSFTCEDLQTPKSLVFWGS